MQRRYTDLQLACAVAESKNMREVIIKIGLVPRGANYERVRSQIDRLGLSTGHFARRNAAKLRLVADEDFADAVKGSKSVAATLRGLGVAPSGSAHRVFRERVERLGLDTGHMTGQGWRKGATDPIVEGRPLDTILVKGRLERTSGLRKRLIRDGVKEHRCESCCLEEWLQEPISLELHHVNGDRTDNRLQNLKLLCPNCHAQTSTFRGRNIGKTS